MPPSAPHPLPRLKIRKKKNELIGQNPSPLPSDIGESSNQDIGLSEKNDDSPRIAPSQETSLSTSHPENPQEAENASSEEAPLSPSPEEAEKTTREEEKNTLLSEEKELASAPLTEEAQGSSLPQTTDEEAIQIASPADEATASLDNMLSSTGISDLPELMSALDGDLLEAPKTTVSIQDVIGAEVTSQGDGEGAEIASSAHESSSQSNENNASVSPQIETPAEKLAPSIEVESTAADWGFLLHEAVHPLPPFPPASEDVQVFFPMLRGDNERMAKVALQSLREMSAKRLLPALLAELQKTLKPEEILDDGRLVESLRESSLGTLWTLLQDRGTEASLVVCTSLYHTPHEEHPLLLHILPHLPPAPSIFPHLTHFILRLDEHLAKFAIQYIFDHKDHPTIQAIGAYLRDHITTPPTLYAGRILRLLQKLDIPDLVEAAAHLSHAEDPTVAEVAARITFLAIREEFHNLPPTQAKITPPPISVDAIFSGDLEEAPRLSAPHPHIEKLYQLLAIPSDALRKDVVHLMKKFPPDQLTLTLLHHFPGSLTLQDITAEGHLTEEKRATQEGLLWHLLSLTPESAATLLLPFLAHKQLQTRLLTFSLLKHLPLAPLIPNLFRFLLDFNPQIVEASRKLLRKYREHMAFQKTLEWMREQLEYSDPTQAIRAVNVLAVLRDTVCIPTLIEMLQHEDRELALAASQALTHITKQQLGDAYKKWLKWWSKTGSRSERVDWLLESIQASEDAIAHDANQELVELTQQDFGFSIQAGRKERAHAIQQWKTWRKQNPIF